MFSPGNGAYSKKNGKPPKWLILLIGAFFLLMVILLSLKGQ
jgi:hypothetical protein